MLTTYHANNVEENNEPKHKENYLTNSTVSCPCLSIQIYKPGIECGNILTKAWKIISYIF